MMINHNETDNSDDHAMKDFFISYAVENWKQAKWIHQQLDAHGYRAILAGRDFRAGNNFVLEIDHALKTSAAMIAVISPHYLASPYTQAEWAAVFPRDPTGALGLITPVFVEACEVEGLLGPLLRINLIDLLGKDDQQAQKRLLQAVRRARPVHAPVTAISGTEPPPPSSRLWHVPFPRNPLFTGREDLLEQLHQKLTSGGMSDATSATVAALTQPQALKGLGGIGKTQLALEYAYRYQHYYPHVFWVNAATEEALIASFVAIADLLPSFPAKSEQDQNKIVEAVKHWLEQSQTPWLLIFDNADEIPLVRPFLPKSGPGHILFTTRARAVGSIAASLEVEKMSLMEGACLLLRRVYGLAPHLSSTQVLEYVSVDDVNEAGNIVAVLDYLPLALDQAGAYIEETGCGFAAYLDTYRTHRNKLLARRGTQATNYPYSVATTWSLSFQKVKQANPAAAELLRLCAFLDPDAIPEELIRNGASHWTSLLQRAVTDSFAFNQMIEELLKFSLVKRLVESQFLKALSIHRLVQAVLIDTTRRDTQRRWAKRVVLAVNDVFPNGDDVALWPQCLRYLSQVQMCSILIEEYALMLTEAAHLFNRTFLYLQHHALYDIAESLIQRAISIFEQELGPEHFSTTSSLNNLAVLYQSRGKYSEAELLFKRVLSLREQRLGPEHFGIAVILNNLVTLYSDQGKYAEAELLCQRVISICEQELGPEEPYTVACYNNLAELYRSQGKYSEAEPLYQRVLSIRERQLGPEHPDIALSLNNLALLYSNQGKYSEAEPLHQRALLIHEKQFGPEHPNTANSLTNLANLYCEQGKYSEAESFYQRALSIFERRLGTDHPKTVQVLNELASFYRGQHRDTEAELLYRQILSIDQRIYGLEHPEVAADLAILALLYSNQKKYEQAESLYRQALVIREKQLGDDHLDTASSLNSLAVLYDNQGNYEQAGPLYQRVLTIREKQLGTEHLDTASSLNDLAVLYYNQDKYAEAEPLYQRALAIREKQLGTEHPDTANSLNNLAVLYDNQGNYEQAGPLYQRVMAIYERQLGANHFRTAVGLNNLAKHYSRQGKYAEAEPLYQRALAIREKQLGDDHPGTASSLDNLAELYDNQGNYEQAEPLYQRVLAIREKQLGDDHPDTLASLNSLAVLYDNQSKYEQAEPLYQRALAIREKQLGTEHPDTASSLNNLAMLYEALGKYLKAEPLYRRALTILEDTLGREHPDTQTVRTNYADLKRYMGYDAESKDLQEDS